MYLYFFVGLQRGLRTTQLYPAPVCLSLAVSSVRVNQQ